MNRTIERRKFLRATAAATAGLLPINFLVGCRQEEIPGDEQALAPTQRPLEPDVPPPDPDDPNAWGDLTGRMIYDGPAPDRARLVVDTDIDCCGHFDIRDESLMVSEDGALANVFVYPRRKPRAIHPDLEKNAPREVVLDNLDCIFQPHCMAIWIDRQVYRIVNSDPVAQNVAFSPPFDRKANIVLGVGKEAIWEFECPQSQPVPILCNYHPWEIAYILPLDHPYVAITAADGTFTIPRLPVAHYELSVWHERPKQLVTPEWPGGVMRVDVQAGRNDLGTFRLAPALFERD